MASDFQTDIDAIGRIGAVPTILDVVCRTTGMGFAAVARVIEDRWVANAGAAIEPDAMQRLFQPFFRGEARPGLQGLGLGLYIAAEIARAHGGALTVASRPTRPASRCACRSAERVLDPALGTAPIRSGISDRRGVS
ncbi:MAG TPA: ATP-binding protein [Aliidongia sp.]|uniref:ATP-binding protein n=1 Tax=Aliidongia sp. TaxID=1914230 RepID=UPI002DDD7F52|nr:ATP-binding protein [Aliidongia sp.]HEV2672917.1 ATP-binding protein [Aliidongia sp.]